MRVDKAVPVLSSSAIGEEVNKLVKQYKKEAKGEDRYELLTNYLDLLVPALLKTAEKSSLKSGEEELEKYRAENMELTRRLANQRAIGQQR